MTNDDVIRILREYQYGGGDGQTHFGPHSFDLTDETVEYIIAVLERDRWISVDERLPKYGERVLVFGGVTMYVAYYDKNRYDGESWHKLNSKSHYCNPTHWRPLPEPPKEDKPE